MPVKRSHDDSITASDISTHSSRRIRRISANKTSASYVPTYDNFSTIKSFIASKGKGSVKAFTAPWGPNEEELPVNHPELIFAFFEWTAERLRLSNCPPNKLKEVLQVTEPVLKRYVYCNVYRLQDRGTQFLLSNVLARGPQDLTEQGFRLLLYRVFNKTTTWDLLENSHLGPTLTWQDYNIGTYFEVLNNRPESHGTIYTGAHQVSSSKELGPNSPMALQHLRFIYIAMSTDLPGRLAKCRYFVDAVNLLLQYPGIGRFNANQYVFSRHSNLASSQNILLHLSCSGLNYEAKLITILRLALDFNMLDGISYPEDEWICAGPGAIHCLQKMFSPSIRTPEDALHAMAYLQNAQWFHWKRIGHTPRLSPDYYRTGVNLADIEHALCEVDKWSREAMPWIKSGNKKPGRTYVPRKGGRPQLVLPPKLRGGKTGLEGRETDAEMVARRERLEGMDDDEYFISHIVGYVNDSGRHGRDPEYRVRWTDYPFYEDTSKVRSNLLEESPEIVQEWDRFQNDIQRYIQESLKLG